jgi:DNA-binding FrmR family transcriptional regulator
MELTTIQQELSKIGIELCKQFAEESHPSEDLYHAVAAVATAKHLVKKVIYERELYECVARDFQLPTQHTGDSGQIPAGGSVAGSGGTVSVSGASETQPPAGEA